MKLIWWRNTIRYVPFLIWAWLIAPWLVQRRVLALGNCNNRASKAIEPRLPVDLSDYMTPDNSLWGDDGHKGRTPNWQEPEGMVSWLRRNPAYGRAWRVPYAHVLAHGASLGITGDTSIHAGSQGEGRAGWYRIEASDGAYETRRVRKIPGLPKALVTRTGWQLSDAEPGSPCLFLLSIRLMPFQKGENNNG